MKLHYKSAGTGESVVILHGLFGMLDNWQTFAGKLSESYHVLTPDLRNHGRSPHSEEFNYEVMADDILEFIREHDLAKPTLMGHSLGGKVIMQLALSEPEACSRLIVVDMAPRAYPPGHDKIIEALQSVQPETTESRKDVEEQLMARLDDRNVVLFLMKNLGRTEDGGLTWRMNLPVLAREYETTISGIESENTWNGPALFVRGGRSSYIRDEDMDHITALFPKAELITIPDAGHWVHADAMDALLDETHAFLNAHPIS